MTPMWRLGTGAKKTDRPSAHLGDAVDLAQQLGELRVAGVLVPEEFDARMAEVLRRL